MECIAVSATYEAMKHGEPVTGRIEFVARVTDSPKGLDLVTRAQRAVARRAVARRVCVRLADVKVLGSHFGQQSSELDAITAFRTLCIDVPGGLEHFLEAPRTIRQARQTRPRRDITCRY